MSGSKTFIRVQAEELRAMCKAYRRRSCRINIYYFLSMTYTTTASNCVQAETHTENQLVYSSDIAVLLDESTKHLALREDESSSIYSEEIKHHEEKPGRRSEDARCCRVTREQTKTLEEAMVIETGKTLAEWMEALTPKPTGD